MLGQWSRPDKEGATGCAGLVAAQEPLEHWSGAGAVPRRVDDRHRPVGGQLPERAVPPALPPVGLVAVEHRTGPRRRQQRGVCCSFTLINNSRAVVLQMRALRYIVSLLYYSPHEAHRASGFQRGRS